MNRISARFSGSGMTRSILIILLWLVFIQSTSRSQSDYSHCRPDRPVPVDRWRGEYFNNRALSGAPATVRDDGFADLSFDWGLQSPAPECGLKPDQFSVRWMRKVAFAGGVFRFTLKADDGVRLMIDGATHIDDWNDRSATVRTADVQLKPGIHLIVIEYYENFGSALIDLSWRRHPCFDTVPPDHWKGEFFEGTDFGEHPVLIQDAGTGPLDFSGLTGKCLANHKDYSIRWSQRTLFNEGNHRFSLTADGSARLYIDGNLIIDRWASTGKTGSVAEIFLTPGNHTVVVEYRRYRGKSGVKLDWRWLN